MTADNTHPVNGSINDASVPSSCEQRQPLPSTNPFPMYGVPEQHQQQQQPTPVVVVNQTNEEGDDCAVACLGTACCGIIGLCCFGCMCNTPTGRVGASTGCIFYGGIVFVLYLTILLLYKKDDCEDSSASGALCESMSMGRIIANVVIAAVVFVVAIILRIKFVRDLKKAKQSGSYLEL